MLPWALCGLLAVLVPVLLCKVLLLHKSMDEIARQINERLEEDTNNLIFLSTADRRARRLAAALNVQLRRLRGERRRFQQGDRELKCAVTNISHDLRTPLAAIYGYLDLLEREDKSPAAERYLAIIRDRAELMEKLTGELFRYSVILADEGERVLETVDLNAALEESVGAFYTALKARGIAPEITIPEERVLRKLDRAEVDRVLSNLLSNAVKYSGGDLTITLTAAGELTFSNAAPGLDPVQVGRLFDRFYTVEAARQSTGLGLSIARTLTERMGGSLDAEYAGGRLTLRALFQQAGDKR